ncbi:MAG: 50S ribosomal protein L10 [Desulfurococcaceae archaeon]
MSMSGLRTKKVQEWKLGLASEIAKLANEHRTILVADLSGVPAKHVQMLRKKLDKVAILKVVKPKVALKALESLALQTEYFKPYMTGQVMFIFSNINAFELASMVENFVTKDYYAPGEVVDREVVIPEGNTGLPAGPILSVFGRLKIPTKVEGNVVYVVKDTVIAKPGNVVSADLAALLQKLGLALKEIRIRVKCARDGNLVIPGDKLKLNIAEYEEMIRAATIDALKLALELLIPEPTVLQLAIVKAEKQALALLSETGFITPETAEHVLKTAYLKALALATELSKYIPELKPCVKLPGQQAQQVQQVKHEEKQGGKKEKAEESKEPGEDALAEGFTALFG